MKLKKTSKKKKDEIKKLTNKFKELKSLIYGYKDLKEGEIKGLKENQNSLKNEIEINQKYYEKLIDNATNEISNFVEKASLDKLS